jgi:hypothetical protein
MATDVYINIKDLPELSEINNGDYFIIETSTGTHILNFENLIIPTENNVIANTVNQNASAFNSYVTALSSNIDSLYTNNNTISSNLEILSASYESNKNNLSAISGINIKNSQVTIKAGDNTASTVINAGSLFNTNNILITPVNRYAALYPAYIDNIDTASNLITIKGTFKNQTATFNTVLSTVTLNTDYIDAEEDAIYNVFVILN